MDNSNALIQSVSSPFPLLPLHPSFHLPQTFPLSSKATKPTPYKQDRNIILSQTFEYRLPPPPKASQLDPSKESVTLDMTSRYLGLVVVPGEYVMKIEVEEFASQMKGKGVEQPA